MEDADEEEMMILEKFEKMHKGTTKMIMKMKSCNV
jgi:hypothetical protein